MGVQQNNIPVHVALLLTDRTAIIGFLLPNITLHSPRHAYNRLLEINNITVHPEPVQRLLHSRRPNRVPTLGCGNFAERLEWAQNELDWTDKELSIQFSDEYRFGFHPDSRTVRAQRGFSIAQGLYILRQSIHTKEVQLLFGWGYSRWKN